MHIDKIKEAYGENYEENKDIIDENGWIRVCNKTSPNMGRLLYHNKDDFDSRVESLPDMFKSYARPKSLSTIHHNEKYFIISDANHQMHDINRFTSEDEAREFIKEEYTNRNKNDGYDEYWRNRKQIVIKVTKEVLG